MNYVHPIRDADTVHAIEERLAALDTPRGKREYLMFECGIYLGLRISDLVRLKAGMLRGRDYLTMKEQKTGKENRMPIGDTLKRVLRQRLKEYGDNDYIFISRQHDSNGQARHITRKTAYNDIQQMGKDAGINFCIGCHTLRKTFGYHFYRQTGNIALLMVWFNHSSAEITKRYIGIDLDERAKAVKRFRI